MAFIKIFSKILKNLFTFIKAFFKSFAVAFSLYSKIPMPRFVWASVDMKYHFAFFPVVGLAICALEFLLIFLQSKLGFGSIFYLCLALALPVLVTGGIHLDGFMDTADALSSYGTKEKKLEILKDPHIGAFSVISVVLYFLCALGFLSEIKSKSAFVCAGFSFVFSRIFSGLSVVFFRKAKNDGMAKAESENSAKKTVGAILILEFAAFSALLAFFLGGVSVYFFVTILVFALLFFFYYFMSKKNFGGITGDLAGFFVCVSELCALAALSVCEIILR